MNRQPLFAPSAPGKIRQLAAAALIPLFLTSGAGFRKLGKDLKMTKDHAIIAIDLSNADQFSAPIYGVVLDTAPSSDNIISADVTDVPTIGVFGFYVEDGQDHYVGAFVDLDKDQKYDSGEPAWYHANESGEAIPLPIDPKSGKGRTSGELSTKTIIPDRLVKASQQFQNQNGGSLSELAAGMDLKIALGEIADLNDPKFSSARGEEGLWEPASFPLESGIGIYFLEAYDPKKIPVLFVYGMSGSPQDWRTFFRDIDRSRFQPWFFYYPTGRRLDEMGEALNRGIKLLHRHYGFAHLKVVAHSMGGLVSRSFVTKNVLEDGNRYIDRFITISSPWGGHEAAAMGVKHAPKVVPSWYDMQTGSKFQQDLYEKRLRGVVDHHLIFGYAGEKSMSLPSSNDGTVSVASELFPAVQSDVVSVAGFNSDHVGILSNPDVIALVGQYLMLDGTAAPPAPQTSSERKGLLKLLPALP